jgi:hypothetical protein
VMLDFDKILDILFTLYRPFEVPDAAPNHPSTKSLFLRKTDNVDTSYRLMSTCIF